MGKGGDKGKGGKGSKGGKVLRDPSKPYRGSRAGKCVQEKRQRAHWRSQGWELIDNEWRRLSDLEEEEYEPPREVTLPINQTREIRKLNAKLDLE